MFAAPFCFLRVCVVRFRSARLRRIGACADPVGVPRLPGRAAGGVRPASASALSRTGVRCPLNRRRDDAPPPITPSAERRAPRLMPRRRRRPFGNRHDLIRHRHHHRLACPRVFRRIEPRRGVGVSRDHRTPLRRARAARPLSRAARRAASNVVVSDRVRADAIRRRRAVARAASRRARRVPASEHGRRAARSSRRRGLDRPLVHVESRCADTLKIGRAEAARAVSRRRARLAGTAKRAK
ncbi:putative dioxygenase domain protein [Burkholderia pseudomallei]|nr:putative dioxygenase domain protein [Burkholderia pseudomallei]